MFKKILILACIFSSHLNFASEPESKKLKLEEAWDQYHWDGLLLSAYQQKNNDFLAYCLSNGANLQVLFFPVIEANDIEWMEYLLINGININAININNQSPLMVAISCNHEKIIDILINNNCDVHYQDTMGNSALTFAIKKCTENACQDPSLTMDLPSQIRHLMDIGAQQNDTLKKRLKLVNYLLGEGVIINFDHYVYRDLHEICNLAHISVSLLLVKYATANELQFTGYAAILFAVKHNNNLLLDKIVDKYPDILKNTTDLECFVTYSSVEMFEKLISLGLDIHKRSQFGETVLMHAALNQKAFDLVSYLLSLDCFDINEKDCDGHTAFTYACRNLPSMSLRYRNASVVRANTSSIALRIYHDINFDKEAENFTEALKSAANLRSPELFKLLIDKPNIKFFVDEEIDPEDSILCEILHSNNVEILKLFINKLPNLNFNDKCDFDQENSWFYEACSESPKIVDFMMQHQPDIVINSSNRNGETPLHSAVLSSSKKITQKLIAYGADIYAKNDNDELPIDCVTNNSNPYAKKCKALLNIAAIKKDLEGNPIGTARQKLMYLVITNNRIKLNSYLFGNSVEKTLNVDAIPYLDCAFELACEFKLLSVIKELYKALKLKYVQKPGTLNMLRMNGIKAFAPTDQGHEMMIDVLTS